MNLQFFGTGSSTPSPNKEKTPFRSYSGLGIEIGNDYLLFDIGPGCVVKMLQEGINILKKPTHLFIGHYHLDHCLDYITIMKARGLHMKYTDEKNFLEVFGPNGLESFSRNLFEEIPMWNYLTDELRVFEILKLKETMDGTVKQNNSWKVSCANINHYNGVCYKIESGDKSVVYSGDMGYDKNICDLGKNADIAILECSYPSRAENKGLHLCPEDIGELAKIGNFKKIVLTHLYPACEGRENEIIKKIKDISGVDTEIAYDTYKLNI